jgi:D-arabinose 1-dehydrogenase-like Zn-dependent alcohol dehydrogenase
MEPDRVEVVDDWPEAECGPTDVVVQIRGVGLCGSDLSVFDGKRQVPRMPWVFGHEGGGDIVRRRRGGHRPAGGPAGDHRAELRRPHLPGLS